jgi:predicted transcriptional regulator
MKRQGISRTIYVPPEMHDLLENRAKQLKRSFSSIAVELLEEQLKQEEIEQAKVAKN